MQAETETNRQTSGELIQSNTVGKVHQGLLLNFIVSKMRGYKEPKRKGTPWGQKIGFSRKKYAASLYELTATKRKAAAQTVGVSYQVWLQWRADPEFRALVEQHRQEFISLWLGYVRGLQTQPHEPTDEQLIEVIADAQLYGVGVLNGILERLYQECEGGSLAQWIEGLGVSSYLQGILARRVKAEVAQKSQVLLVAGFLTIQAQIVKNLVHRIPPPEEQEDHQRALTRSIDGLVDGLSVLRRWLGEETRGEEQ